MLDHFGYEEIFLNIGGYLKLDKHCFFSNMFHYSYKHKIDTENLEFTKN